MQEKQKWEKSLSRSTILLNHRQQFVSISRGDACDRKTSSRRSSQPLDRISRCDDQFDSLHRTNLFEWFATKIRFLFRRDSIRLVSPSDSFETRLKYNLIVHECQDADVQQYIFDFLHQLKSLVRRELIDEIALAFPSRRFLFEFQPIVEASLTTVHRDANVFLAELGSTFASCLIELLREEQTSKEIDDEEIQWKLQMRLSRRNNDRVEFDETFFDQMKLVEPTAMPIGRIKSFHCQRLNFQLMCQEKVNDEFIGKSNRNI